MTRGKVGTAGCTYQVYVLREQNRLLRYLAHDRGVTPQRIIRDLIERECLAYGVVAGAPANWIPIV